jgi:hypothetical protein
MELIRNLLNASLKLAAGASAARRFAHDAAEADMTG